VSQPTGLKRSLSLPLLICYGVGTTVGAGIYVLVGKVTAEAGLYAPIAFILASLIAAFSAFSFAELSARFPVSAGEAVYIHNGLRSKHLALLVGLLVITAGTVSSAAIAQGFVGYLAEFLILPRWLVVTGLLGLLGIIAILGIAESVTVAAVATVIEVGGLLAVMWGGRGSFSDFASRLPDLLPPLEAAPWFAVLGGAVLAFYAFIGFEDMVNVAEEVKDVRRTMPAAIIATLVITTLCYVGLIIIAVMVVPVADLAASEAPLSLLFERTTGVSSAAISVIAMIAVVNGALVQIIMAARVLYGLAVQGWMPSLFARIHAGRRTPLSATVTVTLVACCLALWLPLVTLAELTSLVTLVIFALVNLSLIAIRRRQGAATEGLVLPLWVPYCGLLTSAALAVIAFRQLI